MTLRSNVVLAAAMLSATVPAIAQSKDAAFREMQRLERQIQRTYTTNPARTAALKTQHEALRQQLFGLPTVAPVATGAQNLVAPAYSISGPCGSSVTGTPGTTVTASSSPALAILDYATASDSIVIGGLGTQTFDVDMTVAITHTWAADMVITLQSPLGTTAIASGNNGGANDDVFNGTLFDDQSANPAATYLYTNGVAAPDLSPDVNFNAAFAGENPNGSWTISIADVAGGDVGVLSTWSLSVTDGTVVIVPPVFGAPTTTSTGAIADAIADYATTTTPLVVSGATTSIAKVEAYVEITHTWGSDMQITLQSPLGTLVDLSYHEGGSFDDTFNGTLFRMDSPNPIGSYAFVNLVAAPDLQPSGDLNLFNGEDANGTWNLVVYDWAGGDIGFINRFDVTVLGCGSAAPVSYCTAGTTTNGCNATMSATANPSLTSSVCQITVNDVEGAQSGIMFYGLAQSATAWGAGTSFLCVKAPLERTGVQVSTGVNGTCGNTMFLDWDAYQLANPSSLGQPFAAGNKVYVQGWFRDPPAPKTTSLSDGLELTYQP